VSSQTDTQREKRAHTEVTLTKYEPAIVMLVALQASVDVGVKDVIVAAWHHK
jgi:hypothetical protein